MTMGLGGAQNFAGVAGIRFVLGMFEAGKYWLKLISHLANTFEVYFLVSFTT